MKQYKLLVTVKTGLTLVFAILLVTITSVSSAAEQAQAIDSPKARSTTIRPAILYKAPLRDDPPAVVSQSARSMEGKATILQVLAPDHAGLTLQPQPILYWYARTPITVRFTIAATEKPGANPLLKVDIKKGAGIQQLDLGKHDISLQPELSYQWSVVQLMDKGKQSTTTIASGIIERIKPGEGLSSRIKKSQGTELVNVYAIEGIWYDALETISSMIDSSPEDQSLVAIRKSLLQHAGLQIAAEN